MSQGSAYTGQFGMELQCGFLGCWPSFGWVSIGAGTVLTSCAQIGQGAHPASFWFSGSVESAALYASFYDGADCTGFLGGDAIGDSSGGEGWQQSTGTLLAPEGTQSALFSVYGSAQCEDMGSLRRPLRRRRGGVRHDPARDDDHFWPFRDD